MTSSLFAVEAHISTPEYYLSSFLAKNSHSRAEYVMHWAWKTQTLINLFCSNFSPPWSTFQTQAFLEKSVHSVKEPERSNLQTLKTLPSQVPTPSLESRICNANLSTFFHPGKREKYQSNGVILCGAKRQHIFPAVSFLNSWCMNLC